MLVLVVTMVGRFGPSAPTRGWGIRSSSAVIWFCNIKRRMVAAAIQSGPIK